MVIAEFDKQITVVRISSRRMESRRRFIGSAKQCASRSTGHAQLDFENGGYVGAFLKPLAVIRDIGTALSISIGSYVPSNKYFFKLLYLHDQISGVPTMEGTK